MGAPPLSHASSQGQTLQKTGFAGLDATIPDHPAGAVASKVEQTGHFLARKATSHALDSHVAPLMRPCLAHVGGGGWQPARVYEGAPLSVRGALSWCCQALNGSPESRI